MGAYTSAALLYQAPLKLLVLTGFLCRRWVKRKRQAERILEDEEEAAIAFLSEAERETFL
jgi:cytochrome c-type biogenesis protein CcmH/NrfF